MLGCIALRCVSMFMLPASGNVTSLSLSLFTVAHFWEETKSTHTQPEACWTTLSMCLCVLVESQSVISF